MNQLVLAHELRHAQQDQYRRSHGFLDEDVSDFDDRRLACEPARGRRHPGDGALRSPAPRPAGGVRRPRASPAPASRRDSSTCRARPRWCGTSSCCPTSRASTSPGRCGREAGGRRSARPGRGRLPRPSRSSTPRSTSRVRRRAPSRRESRAARRDASLAGRARRDAASDAGGGLRGCGDLGLGRRRVATLGRPGPDRPGVAQRVGPLERRRGVPRRAALALRAAGRALHARGVGRVPSCGPTPVRRAARGGRGGARLVGRFGLFERLIGG